MKSKDKLIQAMVRVNQAGEIAAKYIYQGQLWVLPNNELIKEMKKQEEDHLKTFNELMLKTGARPTLLQPIAKIGGFILGAAGAKLFGPAGAMMVTEAVETAVGQHYNDQIRTLYEESTGEKTKCHENLIEILSKCRDEELEHLQIANENDSKNVIFGGFFSKAIQAGCKLAIQITSKV